MSSGPKPADLLALEVEGVKLRNERMWEAHMRGGDKPGQVRYSTSKVQNTVAQSLIIFLKIDYRQNHNQQAKYSPSFTDYSSVYRTLYKPLFKKVPQNTFMFIMSCCR